MVEEAAPVMISEVKNSFDSDGVILDAIDKNQELDFLENNDAQAIPSVLIDTFEILDVKKKNDENPFEVQDNYDISPQIKDTKNSTDCTVLNSVSKPRDQVRRPTDYIRREAVIRINILENKKKIEMQILKTQLEVEQIKKNAALLEEKRNKVLLEKAEIELEELKKSVAK